MSDRILIWDLPRTEREAVSFLQSNELLPVTRHCQNGHEMHLYFTEGKPFWQCNVSKCRKKLGIRTDTWFVRTRLPFVTIVRFIYCWSIELNSVAWCEEQLGMSPETTVDWNNYMREVCAFAVESRNQGKIGGENLIVEIDESMFSRPKSNAGPLSAVQWILGGLCRETGGRFLVTVPNRSAERLFEHIARFVEPGSTIISDCWKDYSPEQLEEAGFSRLKVDYNYNFIDSETQADTQHVKSMWGSAKWRNKKRRGTAKHHLDSYLAEFIWRTTTGADRFTQLLRDFPPVLGSRPKQILTAQESSASVTKANRPSKPRTSTRGSKDVPQFSYVDVNNIKCIDEPYSEHEKTVTAPKDEKDSGCGPTQAKLIKLEPDMEPAEMCGIYIKNEVIINDSCLDSSDGFTEEAESSTSALQIPGSSEAEEIVPCPSVPISDGEKDLYRKFGDFVAHSLISLKHEHSRNKLEHLIRKAIIEVTAEDQS